MKNTKNTMKKTVKKAMKLMQVAMVALVLTISVGMTASASELQPVLTASPTTTTAAIGLPGTMLLTSNTGIPEVDTMFDNLIDFMGGVVKVVGVVAVLFGVVQLGLSIANHDPSQRAQGFLFIAGGVIVFFAPELISFLQTSGGGTII